MTTQSATMTTITSSHPCLTTRVTMLVNNAPGAAALRRRR